MSALTCRGENEALASLKAFGIDAKPVAHATVKTVDEWRAELPKLPENTLLAKNMFLKGKKGELVLVVALAETPTDLKIVCKTVGAGSGSLRFAAEDVMNGAIGVVQGAVTPLALINDAAKQAVTVVLDKAMLDSAADGKVVAFHPCRNDRSVCIDGAKLAGWVASLGYKPHVVDFVAEAAAAPAAAAAAAPAAKGGAAKGAAPAPKQAKGGAAAQAAAGETRLGMEIKKEDDFAMWFQQLITKSELVEYYDVSGCYILRPWAMATWKFIERFFDDKITALGVEPCYFPMFVSETALNREKDHIEGFAPEVAWVTKAGDTKLEVPLAIRPTSETIMYPAFAKWIRSHRDLPIMVNQWCSVVRMEMSHCTPFIRSREFLWQEGHTAHATKEEADRQVMTILGYYQSIYEELLAVPVVRGKKTEKEKFAGGYYTTTVEAFVPAVGRGVQGATSHQLGQNFGKMFDIHFEDPTKSDGSKVIPWQTSWGCTTRAQGVMYMVHGDNTGLVLPPRVAMTQVVLVPVGISAKMKAEDKQKLFDAVAAVAADLRAAGIRAKEDLRDNVSPGWKFAHWELRGVPLRIEVGPSELAEGILSFKRRCDGKQWKESAGKKAGDAADADAGAGAAAGALAAKVKGYLDDIHNTMLEGARAVRKERTISVTEWKDFTPTLQNKCLILAPWCGETKCEDRVKTTSAEESKILNAQQTEDARAPSMGAKALCIPFEQPALPEGTKCVCNNCTSDAKEWVLFGRSY